jgi:hypothetical protein
MIESANTSEQTYVFVHKLTSRASNEVGAQQAHHRPALCLPRSHVTTNADNFKTWFTDVLPKLYGEEHAGFVLLMVAFPLLERYLRQRNQRTPQDDLNDHCWTDLRALFGTLKNNQQASQFWAIFRNGLLHQVTLSREKKDLTSLPVGYVGPNKTSAVDIESDGSFWVQPELFTQTVLAAIESDFATFEGKSGPGTPLPKIAQYVASLAASGKPTVYLGTGGR